MKREVECIAPSDPVFRAAQSMRTRNVGFLPVCDHEERVVGTLTDRDIALRIVADCCALNTPAGDVMTKEAITCRPDDDISVAEELMAKHHKSRMMCVDE